VFGFRVQMSSKRYIANVINQFFARSTLLEKSMIEAEPVAYDFSDKPLVASNVVLEKEEGHRPVDGASLTLTLPTHAVIRGSGGSGREEFARLLARQEYMRSGTLSLGNVDLTTLPDSVTGRCIGYVGHHTHLGSGSLRDVLVYPLLRRPGSDPQDHAVPPLNQTRTLAE
jgi:putative ABC transport system ATP-binding protein